jgi:hypothetical protein
MKHLKEMTSYRAMRVSGQKARGALERMRGKALETVRKETFLLESYFLEYGRCNSLPDPLQNLMLSLYQCGRWHTWLGLQLLVANICEEMCGLGFRATARRFAQIWAVLWVTYHPDHFLDPLLEHLIVEQMHLEQALDRLTGLPTPTFASEAYRAGPTTPTEKKH